MRTSGSKGRIIRALSEDGAGYVSGERLSRDLGITRASIWKHIQKLRSEGFIIEAVPNKGYLLKALPEELYAPVVRKALKTDIFAKVGYSYFESIDSTNRVAREAAEKGALEGEVFLAKEQAEGRGRFSRKWFSPPGGIYFSVILRPGIPTSGCVGFSLVAALSVCEAVRSVCQVPAAVKWPNDIFLEGAKLSGVLTEMRTEGEMVEFLIVGVGLNVNTPSEMLPDGAVSISGVSGIKTEMSHLFGEILERMEKNYFDFRKKGFVFFRSEYRDLSSTLGRDVEIKTQTGSFIGTAMDIDDEGALLVKGENGISEKFFSGDVSVRGLR